MTSERSAESSFLHNKNWWPLLLLTAAALFLGTYARFKGLGTWGLGHADEYYFVQSVQNVLRCGLPMYPCGGMYFRGLIPQYLTAGLQLLGFSAEVAPRIITAVSSLLVLPAAFLLGRRTHGTTVGFLVVIILAISAWEVEMARFARMYAPFQAIFAWYLVFFLRYTVDKEKGAFWGILLLSILGVFVWEGGVLLMVTNLLPPFLNHVRGQLTARDLRYLAVMALVLVPAYWFTTTSWRFTGDTPPWAPDMLELVMQARGEAARGPGAPLRHLTLHPLWLTLAFVPIALSGWAATWIWRFRRRWLAAAGLLVALVAALAHQFLVFFAVLALLLLVRIVDWRELLERAAVPYWLAAGAAAAFWLAFALLTESWRGDASLGFRSLLVAIVYQFVGYPDFLDMVARQWARAMPILGLVILFLLSAVGLRAIFRPGSTISSERVLLILVVVLLLLVGAADAPRNEMRYFYFLYPVLVLLAITALFRGAEIVGKHPRRATLLGAAVVLGGFMLTEDFRPSHLWRIDSAEITFRQNMPNGLTSVYQGRHNHFAAVDWLTENATNLADLVISGPGIAGLDFYYRDFDFIYVDPSDQRLLGWSCDRGTTERWSNLPLVYSMAEMKSRISAAPRSFLVIDERRLEEVLASVQDLSPLLAWQNDQGMHAILAFAGTNAATLDSQ